MEGNEGITHFSRAHGLLLHFSVVCWGSHWFPFIPYRHKPGQFLSFVWARFIFRGVVLVLINWQNPCHGTKISSRFVPSILTIFIQDKHGSNTRKHLVSSCISIFFLFFFPSDLTCFCFCFFFWGVCHWILKACLYCFMRIAVKIQEWAFLIVV